MSIVSETAKDVRQASIRELAKTYFPMLLTALPFWWTGLREWTFSNTTREQQYYTSLGLIGLLLCAVWWLSYRRFRGISSGGSVEVVSAQYGAGTAYVDVTKIVRGHVHSGVLDILATTTSLGVPDPLYKSKKELTVVCRISGNERTFHVPEGRRLTIP